MLFGKKKEEPKKAEGAAAPGILEKSNIIMGCENGSRDEAIRSCGEMLVAGGYVKEGYIDGMFERDKGFSTAIGNAIAIPHGVKECKKDIIRTGLVVRAYPGGIDWNGQRVKLVIGIAAGGDEHLGILGKIVEAFEDESAVDAIVASGDADAVYALLAED